MELIIPHRCYRASCGTLVNPNASAVNLFSVLKSGDHGITNIDIVALFHAILGENLLRNTKCTSEKCKINFKHNLYLF